MGMETAAREPASLIQDLHAQLAMASWRRPASFADTLVRTLVDQLRLAAASLWLFTDAVQPLRLRASVGLVKEHYESAELDLSRFPGQAVLTDSVLEVPAADLRTSWSYRDKGVLPETARGGMVVGPLKVPDDSPDGWDHVGVSGVIGALCVYPRSERERRDLCIWLGDNGDFLGRLYIAALERYSMGLRRSIVEQVAFRKDLASLEHNFLELALRELSVEAAQLWVVDPEHRLVYLHREIGYQRRSVLEEDPLPYRHDGPVMRCFATGETLIHGEAHALDGADELADGLGRRLSNALLVPLPLASAAKIRGRRLRSAGVFVVVNHYATLAAGRQLTPATWEDRFVAKFSGEMLAVLMFQMLKSRDHENDFERLMHGARSSLQAPMRYLLALDQDALAAALPDSQRNYVSDSIFWLDDLMSQISRNELIGKPRLELSPVHVVHDVLTKVAAMARRMVPQPPNRRPRIEGLENSAEQRMLPRVLANEAALTCVFRNLVDNGVKYAPRDVGFVPVVRFDIAESDDGARVVVTVADNGIGIAAVERDLIFEDRFRGARARAHVPSGVGRGLYDCRTLLKRMGGEIRLASTPDDEPGTRFEVSLRVARDQKRRR